jgi:hypothetical protein
MKTAFYTVKKYCLIVLALALTIPCLAGGLEKVKDKQQNDIHTNVTGGLRTSFSSNHSPFLSLFIFPAIGFSF